MQKREKARINLAGCKIVEVEHLSEEEIEDLGWFCDPLETLVFTLDNGKEMLIMCDAEGNGAGWVNFSTPHPVHGSVLTCDAAEYKKSALTNL
jgi:hypothetical protein